MLKDSGQRLNDAIEVRWFMLSCGFDAKDSTSCSLHTHWMWSNDQIYAMFKTDLKHQISECKRR